MKKILSALLCLLLFLHSAKAQLGYIDLAGTGKDNCSFIPPPPQINSGLRTCTFNVTYTGFDVYPQYIFQYALDIWSLYLVSNVPIKVNAFFVPLPTGVLGITIPNGRENFPNAPETDTWYATALANSLADSELNAGEFDFDLYLNINMDWYFGNDGACPAGKYDFATVALHELAHGLGFAGVAKEEGGLGSFGMITASDFSPLVTSFPFPNLETKPGIYDLFMYDVFDEQLANMILFDNLSIQLGDEFTSQAIFWEGDNGTAANNEVYPQLYAPTTFALGSSLVHLDEDVFPNWNVNRLMTPFIDQGEVTHDPGPVLLGMMKDMGWNLTTNVGVEETASATEMKVFPNPAVNQLTVYGLQFPSRDIEISDATGRKILEQKNPKFPIDVSKLPAGIFLCKVESNNQFFTTKFVKQ